MKYLISILLLLSSSLLPALEEQTGLGIMIGNPTGVNAKYWFDNVTAVDAGLGYSVGRNSDVSIHSDYLKHWNNSLYFNDEYALALFLGVGGRLEFADEVEMGVRIPFGLAHIFENQSADIFAELAPIFDLLGNQGVEINLAFGGRYYF